MQKTKAIGLISVLLIIAALLSTLFFFLDWGVLCILIYIPFAYPILRIIRKYKRFQSRNYINTASPQQRLSAQKINTLYINAISELQRNNGAFTFPENWIDLWSAYLWFNMETLNKDNLGVLLVATLREYLIEQGNNPKKVEQIQEKSYSFRSYLTRHYSLNHTDQHLDLANYLISMLYRFPFPLTADVMLQNIQKIVDSTKQILAENNDTDSNAISEFNLTGNSQPASVPATIANIIISEDDGASPSPSEIIAQEVNIYPQEPSQTNAGQDEPTAAAPSDPEISIVADTHANQQNEEQANNEKQETQTNQVNRSNGTTSSKHSQSGKFCRHCGNMIDPETKKCTGCGKQYFHLHKIKKQALLITLAAVLVLALIGLNIYQYIDNKNTQSLLQNQLNAANQQLSNTQELISSWRNEYHFYHDNAVIVQSGDTNYHKYGCGNLYMFDENGNIDYMGIAREQKDIANMNLRIYSIDTAESNGYAPCPVCYDISSDFDEWLAKKKQQYYSQNP